MKNAGSYALSIQYQNQFFDLMEHYVKEFEKHDTKGYLFCEHKTSNSIDFLIGSEKFTIVANIQKGVKIIFNVYSWQFDLSSLTRYTDKKIQELTFISKGNCVSFQHEQYAYNNDKYDLIITLNSRSESRDLEMFFEQFEIYIDNKNSTKVQE